MIRILFLVLLSPIAWATCDVSNYDIENMKLVHQEFSDNPNKKSAESVLKIFPNRFCEFNALYGYDVDAGPLYFVPLHDQLDTLLKYVSPEQIIEKYVAIASEGRWYADNIGTLQYSYRNMLLKYPEIIIDKILSLPKENISTAIAFFFDGPHPSQTIIKGEKKNNVCVLNQDFCEILTIVEKQLLEKEHNH